MDLNALTDFVLVAASGGFGRASRKSGRSKATLSRRVIELEENLGVRLFERGGRALRLTDEGQALLARTENLLGEIREAEHSIRGGQDRLHGRLCVNAPVLLSHVGLGRVAAEFCARYPDIQLEVTADDREVNLVEEGYDVVIRLNPRPDSTLVGRCFLRDRVVLAATPEHTRPTARNLQGFPAVLAWRPALEPPWNIEGYRAPLVPRPVARFSSLLMIRDAVRAGIGAGLLSESFVAGDLASGRLRKWGFLKTPPMELWVLHASRRLVSAKVRAFVDHICAAFADGVLVK